MRFELGFVLNWRRHLILMEDRGHGLFSPQTAREVALSAPRFVHGEFVPLKVMTRLYAILMRERGSYPYEMDKPEVHNNAFGKRETVREAYEVGDGIMLVASCAGTEKRRDVMRIVKNLTGHRVETYGDYPFTFVDCTVDNVNALRANRWHVVAPGAVGGIVLPEVHGLDPRLYPYQVEGVRMMMAGYRLLADEQGLGKTPMTAQFIKASGFGKVLICCPASLKLNWKKELIEWAGATEEDVVILHGRSISMEPLSAKFYIANYDILPYRAGELSKVKWDLIAADECHKIQSEKAQRTSAFLKLKAKNKLFISGTPFTSRPIQMYTALHAIAPKVFSTRYNYGMQFCDPTIGWTGNMEFKGASNMDTLHDILMNGICIRRLKADVLTELPEKRRVTVPIMTDEAVLKRDKDAMMQIAELEGKIAEDKNAYGPFEYLKQIAYLRKRDASLDWIADFLESGRKLVVFAVHKQAISDVMERFKGIAVKIDGSTSVKDRDGAVERFQHDEKIRLFVGNVQAAGVGITLTAASDTCTIELGWSCGEHLQAEDRVHRVGQKRGVVAYYLCCPESVEESIIQVINKKSKVHTKIFDGIDDNIMISLRKIYEERKISHGGSYESFN